MGNGIRKLDTAQEQLDANRLAATAFLHPWDEEKEARLCKEQEAGKEIRTEESWGCFHESGKMMACIITEPKQLTFDGRVVAAGEMQSVVSLPEFRKSGNVRSLMHTVLQEFKRRGDLFAMLTPFSFAFYRKYGFELISKNLEQRAGIEQFSVFSWDCQVRRADCAEDISIMKKLYEDFAASKNMVELKKEQDWEYQGNGEFGKRDWLNGDKQQYTYIFSNRDEPNAYLKFFFLPGPGGPFIGTMKVTELVYDSPQAFRNVLGFIYGMRAKLTDVCLSPMDGIDLGLLVPECDKVERKFEGHRMARVLDAEKVLLIKEYPQGRGRLSVHIEDAFMPENTGTYHIEYREGKALSVVKTEDQADLEVTEATFCQLVTGFCDVSEAAYRDSTKINGNRTILEQVFCKKIVSA